MFTSIPKLDLHGEYREIARILINEFVEDNYKIGNKKIAIIHGIGKGIIKKEVLNTLKKNKKVGKYYINFFNVGETIVELK